MHQAKSTETKCTDSQLEGTRISIVLKNFLIFIKRNKETIGRVLIACMMLSFYQEIRQGNDFLEKVYMYFSSMGNTKDTFIQ